jgi:hypothetical protein
VAGASRAFFLESMGGVRTSSTWTSTLHNQARSPWMDAFGGSSTTILQFAEDFRTHMELGKAPNGDACLRCGLSVQPTEEDARHLLELQPHLGKFVAFADLDPRRGVIKQTLKAPHPRAICPSRTSCSGRSCSRS